MLQTVPPAGKQSVPQAAPADLSSTGQSPLLNRQEAAAYLRISPQTLAQWACNGRYELPIKKIGRRAMYRRADLDAFIDHNPDEGRLPVTRRG